MSVLLIEQYWSYMNSKFTPDAAKRLNGPITGIAGLGSVAGGWAAGAARGSGHGSQLDTARRIGFVSLGLAGQPDLCALGEPEQAGREPGATDAAMGGIRSMAKYPSV